MDFDFAKGSHLETGNGNEKSTGEYDGVVVAVVV